MIRLPPSTLVLSRSDIRDFENRRRSGDRAKAKVVASNEDHFCQRSHPFITPGTHNRPKWQDLTAFDATNERDLQESQPNVESVQTDHESLLDLEDCVNNPSAELMTLTHRPSSGHDYNSAGVGLSMENTSSAAEGSVSPSRDEFHYGGFVPTSNSSTEDINQVSSPFVPDDASTPQRLLLPHPRRLRARSPLPRSPLFLARNASRSPEQRLTTGLTPRVASRVAIHNTPGIIFSNPARRPPRRAPRAYRHQTNSFSFDSSERSNVTYVQERNSFSSTSESSRETVHETSLDDELRRESVHDSSFIPNNSPMTQHDIVPGNSPTVIHNDAELSRYQREDFTFSSLQLYLPPPFSSASRNSSGIGYLPSQNKDLDIHDVSVSPALSTSSSPVRADTTETNVSSSPPSHHLPSHRNPRSSPFSTFSPGSLIQRAARVISTYTSRTPSSRQGSSSNPSSSSPTPRQIDSPRVVRPLVAPHTPSHNVQVYNDTLPPASQPQTPAQLPESRHQSRFHPSFTVPIDRESIAVGSETLFRQQSARLERFRSSDRRAEVRVSSPQGLLAAGFRGLYGGQENGDEESNWTEGVRFNNAEVRLWGTRDRVNDERGMRVTPEPEDYRVGRRS